jgi:hypothetical protein
VIFICSLWPMIVNTAVGVRQIPQDYLNVARVLNLSEWKIFTRSSSRGAALHAHRRAALDRRRWLVIVAAEMLTGGVGIGFWVWDEWNNLKVDHILIAIFVIGMVGPPARAGPHLRREEGEPRRARLGATWTSTSRSRTSAWCSQARRALRGAARHLAHVRAASS